MGKFTPGPWTVFTTPSGYKCIRGPNNHRVSGDIDGLDSSDEMNDANIKLIAAAPELLEALKYCKSSLSTFGSSDPEAIKVLLKASAAIAKALGEK